MSALIIIARVIHISSGVFWGGAVLFVNFLLGPSVMAAGPDGAKVMQQLVKRHYFEIVIGAATLTIVSGFYLIWVASGGFAGPATRARWTRYSNRAASTWRGRVP